MNQLKGWPFESLRDPGALPLGGGGGGGPLPVPG